MTVKEPKFWVDDTLTIHWIHRTITVFVEEGEAEEIKDTPSTTGTS